MDDLNYEFDIQIDSEALDVECLEQVSLMMRYSRAQAAADREVERLKERIVVFKSELNKTIQADPDKYGIAKITNDAIAAVVNTNKEYRAMQEDLIEAQYEAQMTRAAVIAISQRKDMLEALIRLHGQQYFAGPSVPRDLSHEAKQRHQQQHVDSRVQVNTRRRSKN